MVERVKPSEIRKKRSRAIARLADEFVEANLDAPFHPEDHPGSGDYNLHYVHLEADPAAEWEFSQRALAISRGEHDAELLDGTWKP